MLQETGYARISRAGNAITRALERNRE